MTKALIPDPLNSDAEYARFYHLDLSELDDTELRDELNYIRALLWQVTGNHWLRERAKVLQEELSRRRWAENTAAKQGKKTPTRSTYMGLSSDES